MGLAHRIIPVILCRGRALVKGVGFDNARSVGFAAQAARIHAMRGVDEVVLLDIAATKEGRGPDLGLVSELSEAFFTPLAVGGGVRSVEDVKALLRAGADKVVIGTGTFETSVVRDAAAVVGRQALVASIDVKQGQVWSRCGSVRMMDAGPDPLLPDRWAREVVGYGAGEILLQSIERDGTMHGYDLDLISTVRQVVDVPIVASGGCGSYQHMLHAFRAGADAVAAGAMFQFTDMTPRGAAKYLAQNGVEVRL